MKVEIRDKVLMEMLNNNGNVIYISILGKRIGSTYAFLSKVVHELENEKLITLTKQDRRNILVLTEKGRARAIKLREFLEYESSNRS